MRFHHRKITTVLFAILALSLSQCGKKTKSQDVLITVSPDQPIVFTTDKPVIRAGTSVTLKGPWFDFTVHLENNTDSPVTIIGLHVDVVGVDDHNMPQTVSADFLPSDNNVALTNLVCSYTDFGTIPKKGVGNSQNLAILGPAGCVSQAMIFTSSGNPKPTNTALIRYSVTVKPIGYFGELGSPTDRFENSTVIYTH